MRYIRVLIVALAAALALAFASPALAQWPTACVDLNDIVEAHLGNHGNVQIYQRTFGAGPAAESACQRDHRADVRNLFAWAFGGPQPATRWIAVDAGNLHTCGIRTIGTIACWGVNDESEASPLPGAFTSVVVGDNFSCGLRPDGTAACWGYNDGRTTPPA